MHHVCIFLETNDYVRVLLIDFSKAFDVVNHVILFKKLLALDMHANINIWLISFITGRTGANRSVNSVCQFEQFHLA